MRGAGADVRTAGGRSRRRAGRSRRRRLALLALLAPTLVVLVADLARRPRHVLAFDLPHAGGYLASIVESAVFWGALLYLAASKRGILRFAFLPLFVALYTVVFGTQANFFRIWNIYLSIDGQIHSQDIPRAAFGTLPLGRPSVVLTYALSLAVALGLVWFARRTLRTRRLGRGLALVLSAAACYAVTHVPVSFRSIQSTLPDMIYFHGMAALVREQMGVTNDSPDLRVQERSPEKVPPLEARPARPRNVLLILQESLRADVVCVEYDPACDKATPFSNRAAPRRMPLLQMRSNASTTAISISNIWSGVLPTESRELLHAAPLLWEYARAAGWDAAYWTSQNLMFGNARLYVQDLPLSHFAVATHLDPMADLDAGAHDRLLTDRVLEELPELEEPFFAVAHFSNVHYPYVYDPDHAPFQPSAFDKDPEKNEAFFNYYKNVAYLSDMAVGRLVEGLRATEAGKRTVVVYTSDHGESFREHWQLGHTSSLYDEEILVPSWIDAPPGTLSPEEEASILAAKDEFVWHLDLGPTLLDLMGLWDAERMVPFRARMIGHPLTRPERTVMPVPLTNCTWVWECEFRNWGLMQGPLKLEAREWDGEYHCFDVEKDPLELHNLGERGCAPLAALARQMHHAMPNIRPPGRPKRAWED